MKNLDKELVEFFELKNLKKELSEKIKSSNDINAISSLIDKIGVNSEINSDSILQCAIKANTSTGILKTIIIDKKINLNLRGLYGQEAIHTATSYQNIKALLMIITAGANLNSKCDDGWTALHYASQKGNIEMIRILIEAGADRNIVNNSGKTPIDVAHKNKNEVISLFKQYSDRPVEPSTTLGGIKTYQVISVQADFIHSDKGTLSGRSQ